MDELCLQWGLLHHDGSGLHKIGKFGVALVARSKGASRRGDLESLENQAVGGTRRSLK